MCSTASLTRAPSSGPLEVGLEVLFGEAAECIGNRCWSAAGERGVAHRLPSEAIADRVNGTICLRARGALSRAGTTRLVSQSKGQFELDCRAPLQVRHRNRQQ